MSSYEGVHRISTALQLVSTWIRNVQRASLFGLNHKCLIPHASTLEIKRPNRMTTTHYKQQSTVPPTRMHCGITRRIRSATTQLGDSAFRAQDISSKVAEESAKPATATRGLTCRRSTKQSATSMCRTGSSHLWINQRCGFDGVLPLLHLYAKWHGGKTSYFPRERRQTLGGTKARSD